MLSCSPAIVAGFVAIYTIRIVGMPVRVFLPELPSISCQEISVVPNAELMRRPGGESHLKNVEMNVTLLMFDWFNRFPKVFENEMSYICS